MAKALSAMGARWPHTLRPLIPLAICCIDITSSRRIHRSCTYYERPLIHRAVPRTLSIRLRITTFCHPHCRWRSSVPPVRQSGRSRPMISGTREVCAHCATALTALPSGTPARARRPNQAKTSNQQRQATQTTAVARGANPTWCHRRTRELSDCSVQVELAEFLNQSTERRLKAPSQAKGVWGGCSKNSKELNAAEAVGTRPKGVGEGWGERRTRHGRSQHGVVRRLLTRMRLDGDSSGTGDALPVAMGHGPVGGGPVAGTEVKARPYCPYICRRKTCHVRTLHAKENGAIPHSTAHGGQARIEPTPKHGAHLCAQQMCANDVERHAPRICCRDRRRCGRVQRCDRSATANFPTLQPFTTS